MANKKGKKGTKREFRIMECTECKERNYMTSRRIKEPAKLELSKFCNSCRKHTPHKERKK